ncbi:LOW QUALITY PROTEIN: Hypothetical protein PHPALM_93 [Phytophthora palmivora]|uniref:PiggyBac transposable element-derived protein domain-containing protein n=1 Tax=Phytophthora palmivora TaxID=4796 RepID=A0A2P4YVQ4_9STRA|nr:LOW QUALITY PROTEIN: Hypothetical protein PHPALM_93 [Phytophthora palmivora]
MTSNWTAQVITTTVREVQHDPHLLSQSRHWAYSSTLYQNGRENTHCGRIELISRTDDPRDNSTSSQDVVETTDQGFKIMHVIGLLIARAVAPIRDGLAYYWATAEGGAISRESFSRLMKRELLRAFYISTTMKLLKLRRTEHGRSGFCTKLGRKRFVVAIASDKPSKWGTIFYMICCAEAAYCVRNYLLCVFCISPLRVDVYYGKSSNGEKEKNVGPTAVVHNITKVQHDQQYKRLIITDNYCSSIQLSIKPHSMGRRRPEGTTRLTQVKSIPRDRYRIAQSTTHPYVVALAWMVSRLVDRVQHAPDHSEPKGEGGTVTVTPCPQLVVDYISGMGGVDIDDQLSLQRYSAELFWGIVGMAIVNGLSRNGEKLMTHAAYMRRLHKDLLALRETNFDSFLNTDDLVSGPVPSGDHSLVNTSSRFESETQSERRQHMCKVCSAFTSGKSNETSYCWPYTFWGPRLIVSKDLSS